jgi:adhesin/invasin
VGPATVTTNADGEARTVWTLGSQPGEQRVTATVSGVSTGATFTAEAAVGAPAQVTIVAGHQQSAPAGTALPVNPSVRVRDRFGNNVSGASVFFAVTAGGGQLASTGATTNAEGLASAGTWTLGATAGTNRLSVLVVAAGVTGNPVEFTATGTAGAANRVVALTETRVTGSVNALVDPRPSVRVTDAAGNPVVGVQVSFTGSTGSSVNGAVTTTDASGVATVESWRLGQAATTRSPRRRPASRRRWCSRRRRGSARWPPSPQWRAPARRRPWAGRWPWSPRCASWTPSATRSPASTCSSR